MRLTCVLIAALVVAPHHLVPGTRPAAAVRSQPPAITVLSTGIGPKRAVRYRAAAGDRDRIEVSMQMTIDMDVPGAGPQHFEPPPIRIVVDIDVDDVAANGDITSRMEMVSASMDGPGIPAGTLDMLKGLSGTLVVSDRGLVRNMEFDTSKIANPAVEQVLSSIGFDRLATPLPEEPVGVGARWEVVQMISANNMETRQKAAYELVAMDATSMTFDVTVEQSAAPQKIVLPGAPMEASLVSMTGEGSGRMTLPDGALALFGEMTIGSRVVMEVVLEGVSQRMSTDTGVKMSVARAARSGPAALDRIVAAERAFAAATRHLGVRDGFLTFLTGDAIDIAPVRDGLAIISLPERLRAQPAGAVPPTRQLLWEPRTGAISHAGDLGWLTGPYRNTAGERGEADDRHGAYFSIWKRQADGTYKVRLDIGIATATPVSSFAEGFTPAEQPAAPPPGGAPVTEGDIRAVEAAFAQAALADVGDAYRARLLPGARLHRNERSPFAGAPAAATFMSGFERIAWAVLHAEVAESGDLAFTAGSYDGVVAATDGKPQSVERGFFVRVWQRDAAGGWKIAFETNGIR